MIDQIIQRLQVQENETHFWRTHQGAELDLLIVRGRTRLGFEIKRTVTPAVTPSMHSALADLKLKSLTVVHAGSDSYPLAKNIHALSCNKLVQQIKVLKQSVK